MLPWWLSLLGPLRVLPDDLQAPRYSSVGIGLVSGEEAGLLVFVGVGDVSGCLSCLYCRLFSVIDYLIYSWP